MAGAAEQFNIIGEKQLLRRFADSAPLHVYVTDFTSGRLLYANRLCLEFFGLTQNDLDRLTHDFLVQRTASEQKNYEADLREQLHTLPDGQRVQWEVRARRHDGQWRWFQRCEVVFRRHADGTPRWILGTSLDITERKQAEQALRAAHDELENRVQVRTSELAASEERWRSLVATAPGFIVILDRNLTIRYINRHITRHASQDLIGHSPFEVAAPEYHAEMRACYEYVLRTGEFGAYETAVADPAGENQHFHTQVGPYLQGDEIVGLILAGQDITQQKQTEIALRESERRYRLMAEHAADIISQHSADGTYLYLSPAVRSVLGYDPNELVGRNPYDLFHPEDIELIRANHRHTLRDSAEHTVEYRIRRKDGRYAWVETTSQSLPGAQEGGPTELVCVTRDITVRRRAEEERQRFQEELHQAQKMQAIGLLASGISHDMSNLATAILGYTELAQTAVSENDAARQALEHIREAAEEAGGIARGLLTFSGKSASERQAVELQRVIGGMMGLLRAFCFFL